MSDERILFEECSIISLRTAVVMDDGKLVGFQLRPAPTSIPRTKLSVYKDEYIEHLNSCMTILYKHPPLSLEKANSIEKFDAIEPHVDIKLLAFKKPPELKLLWADLGNSAAVFLNGEPWAFVDHNTNKAYSKGVLSSMVGNSWNQEVFEKTFDDALNDV